MVSPHGRVSSCFHSPDPTWMSWISQVPGPRGVFSSFPLLFTILPLVTQVSSSLCSPRAQYLHTVPVRHLHHGYIQHKSLFWSKRENLSSTLHQSHTKVAVRGSGRTSPPHIFTLHFWKSELVDTITFRIYILPSAKGSVVTDLISSVWDT